MSTFIYDTYTDPDGTTLSAHASEVGGPLILHSSFTDTMSIQSNRAGKDSGTLSTVYYYTVAPAGVEYTVEGVIVDVGNVNRASGIALSIDTSADNMVVARRQTSTAWQFGKVLAATLTSLETIATSFSAGASNVLRVVRLGDLYYFYLNNALSPLSPHQITDSVLQPPGRVGLRASNIQTATGYHVDAFTASSRYGARLGGSLRPRIFAPGIPR